MTAAFSPLPHRDVEELNGGLKEHVRDEDGPDGHDRLVLHLKWRRGRKETLYA